jgi:hypothetical protein
MKQCNWTSNGGYNELDKTTGRNIVEITFSGEYTINCQTFGINFEVYVNQQKVVCSISKEALQDIDPSNARNTAIQQFLENRSSFEAIAKQKILAGATSYVSITSSDVLL